MIPATEWLENQMENWGYLPRWQKDEIVKKAIQMEKEQRVAFFFAGLECNEKEFNNYNEVEEYCNNLFKSETNEGN